MKVVDIFYVVLSIVSIIITSIIIPLVKQRYGKQKIENVIEMVKIAVNAAEQIYQTSGQGAIKKEYVIQYLKDRNIKINSEELDTIIEACVLELNRWEKEIKPRE